MVEVVVKYFLTFINLITSGYFYRLRNWPDYTLDYFSNLANQSHLPLLAVVGFRQLVHLYLTCALMCELSKLPFSLHFFVFSFFCVLIGSFIIANAASRKFGATSFTTLMVNHLLNISSAFILDRSYCDG